VSLELVGRVDVTTCKWTKNVRIAVITMVIFREEFELAFQFSHLCEGQTARLLEADEAVSIWGADNIHDDARAKNGRTSEYRPPPSGIHSRR